MNLPRLVVAAPGSGHGKTTLATGIMAALRRRGLRVSGHKVGPDYIDPGYHALATGRPGRNLDPYLVGEARLVPLLLHGAAEPPGGAEMADIAVIEGVMGLYDGQLGTSGFASTAHVARVVDAPVVLVVDVSHASRSIAAVVLGMQAFDPAQRIAGVILNKAGSPRHAREVVDALPAGSVLGVIPRDAGVSAPSRHLGLVPAAERPEAGAQLDRLATQVEAHVDLDELVRIACAATDLPGEPWSAAAAVQPVSGAPVIAVAGGRAFTFRYAETTEMLRAAGCRVVEFDPTCDASLPAGTSGLYLGGGFPETFVTELSANTVLRQEIRSAIEAGLPTVAECAGLLYLCRSLDGAPMVGAIDAEAAMTPRLTLGYREAVETSGDRSVVRGHEFHRTAVTPGAGSPAAYRMQGRDEGFAGPVLSASYLHVHWAGHPEAANRFAAQAAGVAPGALVRDMSPRV